MKTKLNVSIIRQNFIDLYKDISIMLLYWHNKFINKLAKILSELIKNLFKYIW